MTLEARTESGALPVIHRREQRVLVMGSRFMSRRAKKTPKGLTANGGDKQFSNRPVTLGYGQLCQCISRIILCIDIGAFSHE